MHEEAAKPLDPEQGVRSVTRALAELMGEEVRLPELVQLALKDAAQQSDIMKQLSGELPAALFERLGLLVETVLPPARGHRPMRPPGGSCGPRRSYVAQSAA